MLKPIKILEFAGDEFKRQVKIRKHQKTVLLDFLEKNFEYSKGAFKLLPTATSDDKQQLWEDISQRLNGIGPIKTSNMWRKTCADLRMQIKKKLIEKKDLTDEDVRLVKFYGLRSDSCDQNSRLVNERVTAAQKTKMVDLIQSNFWYNHNTGKLEPNNASRSLEWDEISERLNMIGGCIKNTTAWRKCWSDIKCDVGKKFANGNVPKMVTEDEYKIATLYGWLNADQLPPTDGLEMEVNEPPVYVVEPPTEDTDLKSTIVIEENESEIIISDEHQDGMFEGFVEQLDEDESHIEEENSPDETDDADETVISEPERTIYVSPAETQTDPECSEKAILSQILAAQLHTNSLLEQLMKNNSRDNELQLEILKELKNNSSAVRRLSQK